METYMTKQGDTWDAVAYRTMGSVRYTSELMKRNRAYLNVYLFPAGVTLILPPEERTVTTTLPPWKQGVG